MNKMSIKTLCILNGILLIIAACLWIPGCKQPVESGIIITDYWGEPIIVTMDPFTIQSVDCRLDFETREELIPIITITRGKALWLHETFPEYRFPEWLCNTHFWVLHNNDTIGYGINNPLTNELNLKLNEKTDSAK